MKNIYLVSPAGCGKTYCSNYLCEYHGYKPAKMALGVYSIAQFYFKMTDKDRKLLQFIGTEAGRERLDNNIWVKRCIEDCNIAQYTSRKLFHKTINFVLDDCRFKNEHNKLKSKGWVGIYLNVPDEIRKQRLIKRDGKTQEECFNHPSEREMEEFKDELIQVDASGTLEEMYNNIDKVLEDLK